MAPLNGHWGNLACTGASEPETKPEGAGPWSKAQSLTVLGPNPARRALPSPALTRYSRFCSVRGRCAVVKARKDSFPMSQSNSPGTWPWRLSQKSRFWSLRSTFRERRHRAARSGREERHHARPRALPQIPRCAGFRREAAQVCRALLDASTPPASLQEVFAQPATLARWGLGGLGGPEEM